VKSGGIGQIVAFPPSSIEGLVWAPDREPRTAGFISVAR
jgi:hypothetical protein